MRRALPLVFALGLAAASAAGVGLGLVAVAAVQRMRGLLGEVEWGEEDE